MEVFDAAPSLWPTSPSNSRQPPTNLQQPFVEYTFFLPSGLVLPAGYSQLSGLCVGQQSIFYYHAQTSELVTANFLGVTRRPFILKCSSYQQYRNQNNGNGNKGIMFIWEKNQSNQGRKTFWWSSVPCLRWLLRKKNQRQVRESESNSVYIMSIICVYEMKTVQIKHERTVEYTDYAVQNHKSYCAVPLWSQVFWPALTNKPTQGSIYAWS